MLAQLYYTRTPTTTNFYAERSLVCLYGNIKFLLQIPESSQQPPNYLSDNTTELFHDNTRSLALQSPSILSVVHVSRVTSPGQKFSRRSDSSSWVLARAILLLSGFK